MKYFWVYRRNRKGILEAPSGYVAKDYSEIETKYDVLVYECPNLATLIALSNLRDMGEREAIREFLEERCKLIRFSKKAESVV